MTLPPDFVQSFEFIHPKEIVARLQSEERLRFGVRMCLTNELNPGDLFCYLAARFGTPNGMQSFLRKDDSDNLIHWAWTVQTQAGLISIQGMNFRTEIWIANIEGVEESDKNEIVSQIKLDYRNYEQKLSRIKKSLEQWIEFVNPFQRLRRSVESLLKELDSLGLDPDTDMISDIWNHKSLEESRRNWEEETARYSKGLGLCFGIRAMLPVMAEAFVNVLMFILLRREIRSDERLRENVFRQPIDVRIKSLSLNCNGFDKQIDYSDGACRAFHTLINERNDLLHGNVSIQKLKFNELMFWGKVPIFETYRSMWERSIGVEQNAVGLSKLRSEIEVVDSFITYVLSCVDDDLREHVKLILAKYDLGLNKKTGCMGILFPDWLVDIHPVLKKPDGERLDKER